MLIDSHCHLDFPELAGDEAGVLARARSAGVAGMLTIGTRLYQFDKVRAIAERNDNIWCSVGVHPHEAKEEGQRTPDRLIEATRHPKVVGIGETGLDFYYEHSPREEQAESFRAHIAASRQTGLPLIVHTRDADAETGDILEQEHARGGFTGLIHCFSSGAQVAHRALALGMYISISGIVTFKAAEALRTIVRDIPLTTTCPHHLMPATGVATVAFAPEEHLVGVGTVARLVDAFARRFALQEQIGERVVAALQKHLSPRWAGCRITLSHACMTTRGVRPHGARVETLAIAGGKVHDATVYAALGVGR